MNNQPLSCTVTNGINAVLKPLGLLLILTLDGQEDGPPRWGCAVVRRRRFKQEHEIIPLADFMQHSIGDHTDAPLAQQPDTRL